MQDICTLPAEALSRNVGRVASYIFVQNNSVPYALCMTGVSSYGNLHNALQVFSADRAQMSCELCMDVLEIAVWPFME